MKRRILIGLAVASIISLVACGTKSLKGATYINGNAEHKPMVFMVETVGVLHFTDNSKVDILFPYAIDTKALTTSGGISISSEMWIPGEYERNGNTITIRFKLNEKQENDAILEVEVKDDGKTLLGEHGERFNKMNQNRGTVYLYEKTESQRHRKGENLTVLQRIHKK